MMADRAVSRLDEMPAHSSQGMLTVTSLLFGFSGVADCVRVDRPNERPQEAHRCRHDPVTLVAQRQAAPLQSLHRQ